MKTTWKQLSRPLRVAIAAPWCLVIALGGVAAVPATRALLLDSADKPTADVSFASSRWTGTLDAARLPASVPLLSGDQSLSLPGTVIVAGEVYAAGTVYTDGVTITNAVNSNGGDPTIEFDASTGSLKDGGSVALLWDYYGVSIPGSLTAGDTTIDGNVAASGDICIGGTLCLGQTAHAGTITPDSYFVFYDSNGNPYRIPCVAQ